MEAPPLPLVDAAAGLRLRRWRAPDAPVLAAAWSDGEVAGPERLATEDAPAAAERWIRGWEPRLAAGLSLDLVVGPLEGEEVWGEVGVSRLRLRSGGAERAVWELGWWLVPERRGQGIAVPAVVLLLGWVDRALPAAPVVARVRPGNAASARVAERVGLARRGAYDEEHDLWVRPPRERGRLSGGV